MLISMLFVLIFSALFFAFQYKNKISYIFVTYFIGTATLIFSLMLYIAKLSNYASYNGIDYFLYLMFASIKINIFDVVRIYNLGLALVMLASASFFFIMDSGRKPLKLVLIAPIIAVLYLNDPSVYYDVLIGSAPFDFMSGESAVETFLRMNNLFTWNVFIVYLILPFFALYGYYKKSRIKLKKIYAAVSAISALAVDAFIYFVLVRQFNMFMTANTDIFNFPLDKADWNNNLVLFPWVVFIMIAVGYLYVRYKPFGKIEILSKRDIMNNARFLNKNLRMTFHIYKNLFFSIERLARQGREFIDEDKEAAVGNLLEIEKVSSESILSIARMLTMLSEFETDIKKVSVIKCIRNAFGRISIPAGVKVFETYEDDEAYVLSDEMHLSECFANILTNAAEAILEKNGGEGHIAVAVFSEQDYICVTIKDDGCGIEKKNINKIFKVLFSTKQVSKNWGVGLNYSKKVVEMGNGYIFVDSVKGEYTKFEIVLPRAKKEKKKWTKSR